MASDASSFSTAIVRTTLGRSFGETRNGEEVIGSRRRGEFRYSLVSATQVARHRRFAGRRGGHCRSAAAHFTVPHDRGAGVRRTPNIMRDPSMSCGYIGTCFPQAHRGPSGQGRRTHRARPRSSSTRVGRRASSPTPSLAIGERPTSGRHATRRRTSAREASATTRGADRRSYFSGIRSWSQRRARTTR